VRLSSIDHLQVRVTYGDVVSTPIPGGDGISGFVSSIETVGSPTVDTKSPTANNSTDCNGFSSPSNAHASDNVYATGSGDIANFSTMYRTFGFTIPASKTITKVELLLESKCNSTGVTHVIDIGTPGSPDTCGNFNSVGSGSVFDPLAEAVRAFDVTAAKVWVPADFDNANLRVLVTALHGQV